MFRPRVIPVLLLKDNGLVKTVNFKNSRYIGDPINAVRIFNDLEADELIFLDILASKENRTIDLNWVKDIGDEAYMPFTIGGGISTLHTVETILKAGAEKVVLNSALHSNYDLLKQTANEFGKQSVVASVDLKKSTFSGFKAYTHNGSKKISASVMDHIKAIEENGAGEIMINFIDNDGKMEGYNLEWLKRISDTVNIPVIACGGAGTYDHLKKGFTEGNASALAAGSLFVYHGPRKGVLINYPSKEELLTIFK